ncbi:RdgB/HAM1 family non-canonical purine NTP pyrophosphatase [Yimella sp. NH-Cas1]|uniref:RdgB/HAM1 family non-canonical purine NTP pyrophosphatase n=1 Tax=Yimella sp. NH-Cas1 TaxID=2917726 RepID=UPI001EFB6142|nr:RdgB/HAM1 family non-canonical purine NTP pyrophosphatase [Yimella sp. NH-Cas1]MCG8655806.1 RdgB/HAM1 family non-canonical purine NTP pyrophosphatase [Yimella sp. NH-Cas1]
MSDLVLATRNAGKIADLQGLIDSEPALDGLRVVGVGDFPELEDVPETGLTFIENATLKAKYATKKLNLPAVADDSGISVDVLGGCPGVFSARWAGRHGDDQANIDLLLAQTADVPIDKLIARFECSVVLAMPDGALHSATGVVDGRLTREQRGTNGFGYDPIFELPDGRTFAEYTATEKHAASHRGQAFRALVPTLVRLFT